VTPEDTLAAYTAAALAHDLDAVLSFVAGDAVYLFSNETCHAGKPAVRAAIARNFEAIRNETYGIRKLRWLARTEDLAVGVYEYEWSGEIDGEKTSGGGRGTTVLRRRGDGWEIVHEHLSRGALAG
jgi:ketosteroid isomerase-like protein